MSDFHIYVHSQCPGMLFSVGASDVRPWLPSLSLAQRVSKGDRAKFKWTSEGTVKKGVSKKTGKTTVFRTQFVN